MIGEHTREVLESMGYSAEQIVDFARQGAIRMSGENHTAKKAS